MQALYICVYVLFLCPLLEALPAFSASDCNFAHATRKLKPRFAFGAGEVFDGLYILRTHDKLPQRSTAALPELLELLVLTVTGAVIAAEHAIEGVGPHGPKEQAKEANAKKEIADHQEDCAIEEEAIEAIISTISPLHKPKKTEFELVKEGHVCATFPESVYDSITESWFVNASAVFSRQGHNMSHFLHIQVDSDLLRI